MNPKESFGVEEQPDFGKEQIKDLDDLSPSGSYLQRVMVLYIDEKGPCYFKGEPMVLESVDEDNKKTIIVKDVDGENPRWINLEGLVVPDSNGNFSEHVYLRRIKYQDLEKEQRAYINHKDSFVPPRFAQLLGLKSEGLADCSHPGEAQAYSGDLTKKQLVPVGPVAGVVVCDNQELLEHAEKLLKEEATNTKEDKNI